jgi:predicted alpha/beta-hydrolase family hydrolase
MVQFLDDGPGDAGATLLLAHGAGGAMDTAFLNTIAQGLGARRIRVRRFEFPYMAARRTDGRVRPPDREPVLLDCWRAAVAETGTPVFIGGKSMGGRMASLVADELAVRGLVCLGYPFHPPGQPDKLRTRHLEGLRTPTLIVQGERDPFGTRDDVARYALSKAIRVEWLTDGEHSFKPRKASGATEKGHLARAVELVAEFLTAKAL